MTIRSTSLRVIPSGSGPGVPLGLASTSAANLDDILVDNAARRIRYLRISVTDRCNYRCVYCMPESHDHEATFGNRSELLSFEEIERIVRVFAGLGVRKVRLTGGEPTIRVGIADLVRRIALVPGIEQVVMTSNGHLLEKLAAPLQQAGLTGIHISVDTLHADRFAKMTGRGDLAAVTAGIAAASAVGILRGINTVLLQGQNHHEVADLCRFAWDNGATPRFIEHMPMSEGAFFSSEKQFSAAQVRSQLESTFGALRPVTDRGKDAGPARYWQLEDGRQIGIISAMTEHFCDDCNRLRLTATGALHACLGYDDAVNLRDLMRAGADQETMTNAIANAVSGKRAGHVFSSNGSGGPQKHMISIGG
jgi:GTP 3',8-cyclase